MLQLGKRSGWLCAQSLRPGPSIFLPPFADVAHRFLKNMGCG
jgi:hypothetical protein